MNKISIFIILFLLISFIPQKVHAMTVKPFLVTEGFEKNVPGDIKVYFVKNIALDYKSGKVLLSLNPDGTGEALVGESIDISIIYPGDGEFERINMSSDCTINKKMPPLDITHLLYKGVNNIQVRYRWKCFPGIKKADPLYLVHFDDYEPTEQPFLDLPWDYVGKGQTFEDAALKISSFFDHQYPLLSTNLVEPDQFSQSITNFLGINTSEPYTRHDGFDYAFISNVKLDDPVIAAADGEASFINICTACGNAIYIDHKNGYQTRYYHLQPEGLITNNPNQKIAVSNRQQIGKVGLTGRTTGAHIHFMVVKDKNNDGNFDDNIPDGLVDPYGWQSDNADPWENYVFDYKGTQHTGSKSFYMWTKSISGLKKTLSPNGGTYNTSRFNINFPQNFTLQDLILSLHPQGVSSIDSNIQPIAEGIDITLWDGVDTFLKNFSKNFILKFKFLNIDISRFDPNTISMYSSIDGSNWNKETTVIDWNKNEATTQVNHLTQFALMGKKLDSISPVTNALLSGTEITSENQYKIFNSSVSLTLIPSDEPAVTSLGIDYTLYKINDGEWNLYKNPIQLTEKIPYTINYYSSDKDGNIEQIKTIDFSILNEIQPEFQVHFDFDTKEFIINPIPTGISIISQEIEKMKKNLTTFTANSGTKTTSMVTQTKTNEDMHIFRINSLSYNNQNSSMEKNKLSIEYIKNDEKKGDQIKQIFSISDTIKVVLLYSKKDNTTKISIQESNIEKTKSIVMGFKSLNIYSEKGKLKYQIN